MKRRARKFAGIWLLIALIVVYSSIAVVISVEFLDWLPVWASLIYLAAAGMGWAIPAGVIIKWMSKPDKSA